MTDPALRQAARDLLKDYILLGREELAEKIAAFGAAQYAAGVAAEREQCARVAETKAIQRCVANQMRERGVCGVQIATALRAKVRESAAR